uniref:DUF5872 domain-containing protein n=1 Tax=Megaviridae environmental sample TaxID=1737588 RepID=A0A5J6VLM2_9VIRU|nr:MAG: hypothetical protein [Megaviridae environmental sample]
MVKRKPLDEKLYNKVKRAAKKKFDRFPSIYASSWITREYVKRGGKYNKPKSSKDKTSGQSRWYKEKWIQIVPYLKDKKKIECGAKNKDPKACRPLRRISKETPPTMGEIVKKYGKEKVLKLARKKNRDMEGRLSWKRGTFKPSK